MDLVVIVPLVCLEAEARLQLGDVGERPPVQVAQTTSRLYGLAVARLASVERGL